MNADTALKQVFGLNHPGHHAPVAKHQGLWGTARHAGKTILEALGPLALVSGSPQGAAAAGAAGLTGGNQEDLFQVQAELQRQVQEFTLRTNITQAEHEARMTVIRGIRV